MQLTTTPRLPRWIAVVALAAGSLTTACDNESDKAVQGSPPAGKSASAPVTAPASPSPSDIPNSDLSQEESDALDRERAAAAPPGDPIARSSETGMPQGKEDFGKPLLTDGDVTVYVPVRRGDALSVPVKITNHGTRRAFYEVDVRLTGPGGFDATVRVETAVVGVYPGTSWPTELTAEDPGTPLPKNPKVVIVKNDRQERHN
ncbi:hypothetical protein [Streptomyces sp. NPDC005955]|uniref:hypothetical protein n=1 Tax=Streptomyces sp. NPDC005955 TaxID=3364738 RepID=UPI0036A1C8FD